MKVHQVEQEIEFDTYYSDYSRYILNICHRIAHF